MRQNPVYAPDGMASAGGTFARFRPDVVHAHDRHDDGLVHNHNWAVTTNFDVMTILGGTPFAGTAQQTPVQYRPAEMDDRYDDGLVHSHNWARTSD